MQPDPDEEHPAPAERPASPGAPMQSTGSEGSAANRTPERSEPEPGAERGDKER